MPIHNLTNVPKSFLKLGQIRKGEKVQMKRPDGSTYDKPVDLDYFRVTFLKFSPGIAFTDAEQKDKSKRDAAFASMLEQRFREVYGSKPTAINVRFADLNVSDVWDANYECYKQGGLVAKAGSKEENGKEKVYWIFYRDPDTMEALIGDGRARNAKGADLMDKPVDLAEPIYKNKKGEPFYLEPVGRLKVVIPELADIAVGYFEFRPESPKDIRNISAELGAYDAVARQYGKTISGIPFILRRREEDVTKKIDGKLVAGKSWVCHLDAGSEWGARALNVIERLALPEIIEAEVRDVTTNSPEWEGTPEEWNEPHVPEPENINQESGKEEEVIELVEVMGKWAVDYAAKQWNTDNATAAKELGKKKLGKRIDKKEFIQIVRGEPQAA